MPDGDIFATSAPERLRSMDRPAMSAYRNDMDIRVLSPSFSVSPQIHSHDLEAIKSAGYSHVICNRPEAESAPGDKPDDIRAACEAAGLTFAENPVVPGQLTMENIEAQTENGKTLAYCASGTRSAIVWALSQAGRRPTQSIIDTLADAGFPMPQLAGQIEALAQR